MGPSATFNGSHLTQAEALGARDHLVSEGYVVFRGVMPETLLSELRSFTVDLFKRIKVSRHVRFQGSSHWVATPRSWKHEPPSRKAEVHRNEDFSIDRHMVVEKLNDEPLQRRVVELLGLENLRPRGCSKGDDIRMLIVSKPPHGPPLYWHQDFKEWNSPSAATPWPHQVFFSYYLTDTSRENGCLRVIPGSHHRRHPLHDLLPNAHEPEVQGLRDATGPIFGDAEGAVDVPMSAGDLVIGDARLLHAAWGNNTDQRRTCILVWYACFDFPIPPTWWKSHIPAEICNADMRQRYTSTRVPNIPWRPRQRDYNAPWGPAYAQIRRSNLRNKQPKGDYCLVVEDDLASQLGCTVSQLPEFWAVLCRTLHTTTFAWADDGIKPNGWIELLPDGELKTKWGQGSWLDKYTASMKPGQREQLYCPEFAAAPNMLVVTFGSSHHICTLDPSRKRFFVEARFSRRNGDSLSVRNMTGWVHPTRKRLRDPLLQSDTQVTGMKAEVAPPAGDNGVPATAESSALRIDELRQGTWQRFSMPDGDGHWWWCELDGEYFLEESPHPWAQYLDPSSGRHYWWKSDDRWFWS